MPGKFSALLAILLFCSLQHSGNNGGPAQPAYELYKKADQLYNLDYPTEATDSLALVQFAQVIKMMEQHPVDSLLFQSWLKTGVLLDVKLRFNEAKNAYLQAIDVHTKNNPLIDSVLFLPCVYAGTAYYHLNNFDSANYYLLQAESIAGKYPGVTQKDRLFNALGALYYENGNYRQGLNYFSRALEIIREARPNDKASAIHFEGNMAASYYRLGQYSQSLELYEKLLKYGMYTSQISINMGKAHLLTGNHNMALRCFRHVDPNELPGVYNDIANVYVQMGKPDSAQYYLDKFSEGYGASLRGYGRIDAGINQIYRGDLLNKKQQPREAVKAFQKAIITLSRNFSNEDIGANPTDFIGSFASFKLFDALLRKASTLAQIWKNEKDLSILVKAHDTYRETINLLRYIEKSYDTDDAKIFLGLNSRQVYDEAIGVAKDIMGYIPSEKKYKDEFLAIMEKARASVVAMQVTESRLKKMRGIDPELLQQERNIKYNIARLNIKSETTPDLAEAAKIATERQHFEIELSRLQKKIEQNNSYYKLKYTDSFPTLNQVLNSINDQQAIINLYCTKELLYIFSITKDAYNWQVTELAPVKKLVMEWIDRLRSTESGRKFNPGETGKQLARLLVKKLQHAAGKKEEWIIIPDDIFHYLPFETLVDTAGNYLLENYAISYHFGTRFLVQQQENHYAHSEKSILSMAPFASRGFKPMNRLPASAAEIAELQGKQYFDSLATKQQFLSDLNRYPIIHLATHAVADPENSSGSYIAFYPRHSSAAENNLYLDELYGLNMDSTDLVIMSACETGAGQLLGSEGVISLSRGFTYAGCLSIVNSLWKADDQATADILKRFHAYLQEGYSKSKALQMAKLDYINSDVISKTPDYWGHLILIGDSKKIPLKNGYSPMIWLVLAPCAVLIAFLTLYKRNWNRKKTA